ERSDTQAHCDGGVLGCAVSIRSVGVKNRMPDRGRRAIESHRAKKRSGIAGEGAVVHHEKKICGRKTPVAVQAAESASGRVSNKRAADEPSGSDLEKSAAAVTSGVVARKKATVENNVVGCLRRGKRRAAVECRSVSRE